MPSRGEDLRGPIEGAVATEPLYDRRTRPLVQQHSLLVAELQSPSLLATHTAGHLPVVQTVRLYRPGQSGPWPSLCRPNPLASQVITPAPTDRLPYSSPSSTDATL